MIPCLEGVDQRSFIDDRTTSGIDDEGGGAHPGQFARADQMVGGRRERHMDRHDIGFPRISCSDRCSHSRERDEVARVLACVIAHRHAKPYGAMGYRLPDPSHTDNPQCLARDFRAQELCGTPPSPTTGSNEGVAFGDAACRRQEQGPGQIRGGIQSRRPEYSVTIRPRCSRGSKIDVVVPDGIVCQNFQPSGCMNRLCINDDRPG